MQNVAVSVRHIGMPTDAPVAGLAAGLSADLVSTLRFYSVSLS
jgi:hypothetical protein